jgi:hypothetical protein
MTLIGIRCLTPRDPALTPCPGFDLGAIPDPSCRKLDYRPGEPRVGANDDIDALPTDSKHLRHFRNPDEMMSHARTA